MKINVFNIIKFWSYYEKIITFTLVIYGYQLIYDSSSPVYFSYFVIIRNSLYVFMCQFAHNNELRRVTTLELRQITTYTRKPALTKS